MCCCIFFFFRDATMGWWKSEDPLYISLDRWRKFTIILWPVTSQKPKNGGRKQHNIYRGASWKWKYCNKEWRDAFFAGLLGTGVQNRGYQDPAPNLEFFTLWFFFRFFLKNILRGHSCYADRVLPNFCPFTLYFTPSPHSVPLFFPTKTVKWYDMIK